jgi:tRNA(fMet)-specific endonuclease VapC
MFDTNAISALVHHRAGWEQFARRIDRLTTDQRLISTITLAELQTMIANAEATEAKRILVWRVLLSFQFLDFDELAAVHAGRIRGYLEPRGIKIGSMDTLLAAHALSIGATVVTGNMREFARVPGLAAENWLR